MTEGKFDRVAPTGEQDQVLEVLAAKFAALDALIEAVVPAGRRKALALTKLEESAMWASKAVTRDA